MEWQASLVYAWVKTEPHLDLGVDGREKQGGLDILLSSLWIVYCIGIDKSLVVGRKEGRKEVSRPLWSPPTIYSEPHTHIPVPPPAPGGSPCGRP